MLEKARSFAKRAHENQMYGNEPYSVHLEAVVGIVKPYGETAQVIGYLHDVLEDTSVTYEQVKDEFGGLIADCVALLTDAPGENRRERKEETYKRMSEVSSVQSVRIQREPV